MDMRKPLGVTLMALATIGLTGCPKPEADLASCEKTALIAPVKAAMAAGIPVVTIDSGINSDDPIAYIATNNVKGGEAAADELARLMGEKGTAGYLIFGKGQVSSDERQQG